jgi:uncharacterized protein YgbK (DUF1537 family)
MNPKIIVLDDDPTGSQTVHSCLLLTRWDVATLTAALADAAPLFFILTNTRGMEAARAADVTREVCANLKAAVADYTGPVLFVSRSDSTLRGHYPVETDVINEVLGPFDATLLTPAFFEGGRITRDSTHYLMIDGKPVPTHETEFARDSVFGYRTAYLPDYVAEKTAGRVAADSVRRLTLAELRGGQASAWLAALHGNAVGVIDGETADDYRLLADAVLAAAAAGKRLLFRSAADRAGKTAAAADRRRCFRFPGARPPAGCGHRRLARRQDHRATLGLAETTRRGRPAARRRPPARRARRGGRRPHSRHHPRARTRSHSGDIHQPG